MQYTDYKEKYIKLISQITCGDEMKKVMREFVETYPGGNEKEFHTFVLTILLYLNSQSTQDLKAKTFDKILDSEDNYIPEDLG